MPCGKTVIIGTVHLVSEMRFEDLLIWLIESFLYMLACSVYVSKCCSVHTQGIFVTQLALEEV